MIKINAPLRTQPSQPSPRTPSLRQLTATLWLVSILGIAQTAQAVDGVGLYDSSTGDFQLVESSGTPLRVFRIGRRTKRERLPIAGNWDGAKGVDRGGDTVGLYDPRRGKFKLRNSNFSGPADLVIRFGGRRRFGWVPLAGDWIGSGRDSIGLYDPRSSTFRLRMTLGRRSRSVVFKFGDLGLDLVPIAGDWNQDGIDTVGLYDSINGRFFLTNSNREGSADLFAVPAPQGPFDAFPVPVPQGPVDAFPLPVLPEPTDLFAVPFPQVPADFFDFSEREERVDIIVRFGEQGLGWRPIGGNWTVSFFDSIGSYDPFRNEFLLRFTNTSGPPDRVIRVVRGRDGRTQIPLAGDWRR